jgi:hypothetical protein
MPIPLLALLAIATAPPPASEEEKNSTTIVYVTCLVNAALKLDDGTSDASTIATAIQYSCPDQYDLMLKTLTRGRNSNVQDSVAESVERERLDDAVLAVLVARKKRREQGSH